MLMTSKNLLRNVMNAISNVLLLKAIITAPITSCEAEKCFSPLKRVKTFLRNSMSEDKLHALAMHSIG